MCEKRGKGGGGKPGLLCQSSVKNAPVRQSSSKTRTRQAIVFKVFALAFMALPAGHIPHWVCDLADAAAASARNEQAVYVALSILMFVVVIPIYDRCVSYECDSVKSL